jgi:hypothetical protein
MAMARKLDASVNAYYWNRMAAAPLIFSKTLQAMPDIPREAKIAASRSAIILQLDNKKVATATPEEVRQAIYDYIVAEVMAGNDLFNLTPDMLMSLTADDINVIDGFDIWRRVPPRAINVVAPNINGQRVYTQILDDNLFRMFSSGGDGAAPIARLAEKLSSSATQGLKNQITQSFVFAIRSIVRDMPTAMVFGRDPGAMIPYYYHAIGAMALLTRKTPGSLVSPELLSRVFQQVTPEDFASQRSKSMQTLREGLVARGWSDMNLLNKSLSAIGIAGRLIMKPAELTQILTGQRALSNAVETAPRLGAYLVAKRRGYSDEVAQLAADTVTGNFSERPMSPSAHSVYRNAGFLNPAVQIFGQFTRMALDPVPARAAAKAAMLSGNVAFWASVVWALNRITSSDEDRKRNAERVEHERLTHMDIHGLRVPFDYGITGGIQSLVWNTLDRQEGMPGVSGKDLAVKMLSEMLPHTSANPIELLPMQPRALAEASMGVSLWRDEYLEPPFMQLLEPPERYFDSTPDLYRWMGRMANASPVRIQHFFRNGVGVQFDDLVRLFDRIEDGVVFSELASFPEVGRLFSRDPIGWDSRSVRDASALAREYDLLRTRVRRLMEDPEVDQEAVAAMLPLMDKLEPVKDAMLQVQRLFDATKSGQATPEEIRELKRRMVETARQGLMQMNEIEQVDGDSF